MPVSIIFWIKIILVLLSLCQHQCLLDYPWAFYLPQLIISELMSSGREGCCFNCLAYWFYWFYLFVWRKSMIRTHCVSGHLVWHKTLFIDIFICLLEPLVVLFPLLCVCFDVLIFRFCESRLLFVMSQMVALWYMTRNDDQGNWFLDAAFMSYCISPYFRLFSNLNPYLAH